MSRLKSPLLPPLSRRAVFTQVTAAGLLAATGARAAALQPVSVRLDWLPGAYHAPLYLALERGYYKDAGLDVEINAGQGSNSTLQLVGSGSQLIGVASLSVLALAVGKGVPVIGIAGIIQKAPESVFGLASSGINTPKDLESKRFGYVPDDDGQKLFDAFAIATKIDTSTIKRIAVTESGMYAALLNGNVDFIAGWANADALKVAKIKPISKPLIFADYGVNSLGAGLFVKADTLQKQPAMLKSFIAATIRGASDVASDPKAGVTAVVNAVADTDEGVITEEMSVLPPYLHSQYSAGHPFGWIAPQDVASTLEIDKTYFGLPASVTPADIYTDTLFAS